MGRLAYRQTDKQKGKETETDRQADWQAGRQAERQVGRQNNGFSNRLTPKHLARETTGTQAGGSGQVGRQTNSQQIWAENHRDVSKCLL